MSAFNPQPASPFPLPPPGSAASPQVVNPPISGPLDPTYSFDGTAYFSGVNWFQRCYGPLPWCRLFKLGGEKPRAALLEKLATRYDLRSAAVAHAEFFEEAGMPTQYPHTALALAPHLLLEIAERDLFGNYGTAAIYYSAATAPQVLAELTQLLATALPPPAPDDENVHILQRESSGQAKFLPVSFTRPAVDLATQYNDDLLPVHEAILRRLRTPDDKGLVILHGPPGTGKTTYLRHLCSLLPNKRKLFVPPQLATQLAEPAFMNLLLKNQNAVLIIEDAEQLLLRREKTGNGPSVVSTLLNLSDGFLADCLHIQIVCSFNTDLALIDPALLRKGRLIAAYQFAPLAISKAQALAASLGWEARPQNPLILADLYNHDEPTYALADKAAPVGFGRREAYPV